MAPGMIAWGGFVYGQDIGFSVVLGHDNQLTAIKFLVAEVDDFWMTAVMFPQKHRGYILPHFQCRSKQTVCRKMIGVRQRIPVPDSLALLDIVTIQNIGKLLEIAYNHHIFCASQSQHAGGQIHLRGFIHN